MNRRMEFHGLWVPLSGPDTIQGKIQRRLLAGEWLNAHEIADEYRCHFTNLSVTIDAMKKNGMPREWIQRQYRDGRHYFGVVVPKKKDIIKLEFSPIKVLEGHVADLEERQRQVEDVILMLAQAIRRRRDAA